MLLKGSGALGVLFSLVLCIFLFGCEAGGEIASTPTESEAADANREALTSKEDARDEATSKGVSGGLSKDEAKKLSNFAIKRQDGFYPIYGSTCKMVDESLAVPLEDETDIVAELNVAQGDQFVSFDNEECYYRNVLGDGYCSWPVRVSGLNKDSISVSGLSSGAYIAEIDGKEANEDTFNDILAEKGAVGSSESREGWYGYLIGEKGTTFSYGSYLGVDFVEGEFSIDQHFYMTEVPELQEKHFDKIKTKEGYAVLDTSSLSQGLYYLESRIGMKHGMALLNVV